MGNPPPDVVWMKGFKPVDAEEKMRERYKPFTRGGPGDRNMIGLFVKEATTDQEGDYRVQIKNEHGEEEYEFKVYVTVAGGMDFRAMLIKKKKKKAPPPAPPIEWIETPVDVTVQEKKDDKAMFGAKLSEKGKVGRWFLKNEVSPLHDYLPLHVSTNYCETKLSHVEKYLKTQKFVTLGTEISKCYIF